MACDCGGCSGIFCGGVPRPARPLRERLEGRRKNPVVRPARKNGCAGPGAPRESGQDGRRGGRQCSPVKRTQRARGVRPEEAPAFRVCPAEFRRLAANSAAGALRVPVSRQVAPSHAYVPMIYCIGDETGRERRQVRHWQADVPSLYPTALRSAAEEQPCSSLLLRGAVKILHHEGVQ